MTIRRIITLAPVALLALALAFNAARAPSHIANAVSTDWQVRR